MTTMMMMMMMMMMMTQAVAEAAPDVKASKEVCGRAVCWLCVSVSQSVSQLMGILCTTTLSGISCLVVCE
jgi:hypothetical protein